MVLKLVNRFFGDTNEKALDELWPTVEEINDLEDDFQSLSDAELRGLTDQFKGRLEDGEEMEDLLPEAFAAVREASRRSIGMRHFDVQLIGGVVLHQGRIAEMKTGEGKTLVATLSAYLNALTGQGVHIVTVNDYLAKRDAEWMGKVYHALGLTVGCLQANESLVYDPDPSASETEPEEADEEKGSSDAGPFRSTTKRESYAADIVYGTNNEFGFDYLRDNMVDRLERVVQRGHAYAIVDEVDNILIDEARTPLIISGPAPDKGHEYARYAQLARRLSRGEDFDIDEKTKQISLSQEGISKIERALNIPNLYAPENYVMTHFVENAIRAEHVYDRDRDYVVRDGEVVIVDQFTGRLMHGRRYSEGLHQAIEAKEGVQVQRESITYATITLQNYFRMYDKLAGMTGTAATEAEEFNKIYELDVVQIPTNQPVVRDDQVDHIYRTEKAKFNAVVDLIKDLNAQERPMLVGTTSIDKSELLSDMLRREGIAHEVLNAKNHAREAGIIAQAGRPGAVTVSTNMAGRGTDIILGGNREQLGIPEQAWKADNRKVLEEGGLFVIGTERHESRRIDNQLRGRSGRQGDPGTTRFFISTEDDIVRRFGGDRISWVMEKVGIDEDMPLENKMVSRAVENAQSKVEGFHFEIRKNLVEYDDVINTHRDVIYKLRQKILREDSLRSEVTDMVRKRLRFLVAERLSGPADNWGVDDLQKELLTIFPFLPEELEDPEEILAMEAREVGEVLTDEVDRVHDQREEEFGKEVMEAITRHVMLRHIDSHWVEHLTAIENMRQGIGLQAVGQRDPLVQYKTTAFQMFGELMSNIERDVAHMVYRVAPAQQPAASSRRAPMSEGRGAEAAPAESREAVAAGRRTGTGSRRSTAAAVLNQRSAMSQMAEGHGSDAGKGKKIGRNDPCFCGSGKKFKRCHGAAA